MAKTREIKKRIKAVGNIRRITKTMQMIATSKFARAQQAATAGKPYTETIFELVAELAKSVGDISHPLLGTTAAKDVAGKELTLILTSDRGLCGPFNGSVLRATMVMLRANAAAKSGIIELVGKKGAGFLKFAGVPIARQHTQFGDKPTYENVTALANDYIRRFSSGELSAVRIVYMKFLSAGKQVPTVLQLLPFKPEAAPAKASAKPAAAASGMNAVYEFSPDAASLLGELLPAAVKAVLFQAFNDAVVSEHIARMVAMKSATDNAGKMGKRLTRVYNRARQAQITTELTEIISGAAALG
jgi:F-type H+-transporting ATPase subunit gamma